MDGDDNHHLLDPVGPGEDYARLFGTKLDHMIELLDYLRASLEYFGTLRERLNILDHLDGGFV